MGMIPHATCSTVTYNTKWPQIFTEPDRVDYPSGPSALSRAVADGLAGWACCAREKPPPNYGKGMVKIAERIGCDPNRENLHRLADELLAKA